MFLACVRLGGVGLLLFATGCMPRPKAPAPAAPEADGAAPSAALRRKLEQEREMASVIEARVRERTDELREAEDRLAVKERELRLAREQLRLMAEQGASANQRRLAAEEALKQARLEVVTLTAAFTASERARLELQGQADDAVALAADYAERVRESAAAVDALASRPPAPTAVLDENRRLRARDETYTPGRALTFSRRKFASMVQGMTAAQLVAYIGEPDNLDGESPQFYAYRRALTYALDVSQPDAGVTVVVDRGVVTRCVFAD